MNKPSALLTVSDSVVDAVLGDEAILLNVASGMYFGLDPVGTRIWELLVEGAGKQEILGRVLDEYDVEPERARTDVEAFIQALASKGLTQEVNR
ncbi:MAG TPA: PqqD family protein [Chloroflexota bacterium]|nr:PqqD family protein [Chloroflexota bacterium]